MDPISGNFKLGNAFEVSTVDSIVNLYNLQFHENIIRIKRGWIKSFDVVMETLSGFSFFKNTIYKTVNLPSSLYSNFEVKLDNIIVTGGSDKNIRFLNFGNSYNSPSLDQEFGKLDCFHLSNTDNQFRKFEYANSGDVCLIKEVLVPQDTKFDTITDPTTGEKMEANGFSYFHNSFLHRKKNVHTYPGHSSTIRDLLVLRSDEDILLASASDDFSIKIWN